MRFDQGAIREIHARVDIATLIGQHVSLKKRGNDLIGLCPFHGEKTPSFHVHPDKGFFKCFGCGVGGDVITFLQKLENLTFSDAVRALAAKAGIELEPENPRAARARSERESIYDANRIAANYFARMLQSPGGAAARAYCERRGFSAATVERFTLGYAPDSWDGLVDELSRNDVELELAAKAGLVKQGQRGYYDFYRDRLMIPTYATTGETIAFGGRLLGDGEPKYLNTSTTPVYVKGHHLYALNLARRAAQSSRTLIVVEGYLDCIALHQAGFENAVASLGTSFTQEQAVELRKYADYVFLCFDGDAAGNSAATKAVDIASKSIEHAGSTVRVAMLPAGDDPDSFLRKRGTEAFSKLLDSAKLAIEYKIDAEVDRLRSGFAQPAKIASKAEALIRELTPQQEWDRWRVYVAGRLQVNVDDLRNSRFFANGANFVPRSAGPPRSGTRHAPAPVEPLSFERAVVGILLEEPALALEFGGQIPPERFGNALYRKIYELVLEAAGTLRETADVIGLFAGDQESLDVLAGLARRDRSSAVLYETTQERREPLERVVERLQIEDAKRRYRELSQYLDERHMAGEPISEDVRAEYRALASKLQG